MDLYATTAEIKTILGISGSSKDTLIGILNNVATRTLNGLLNVKSLAAHSRTKELCRLYVEKETSDFFVILSAMPLIEVTAIYDVDDVEITDFTAEQRDDPNTRRVVFDSDDMNWRENIKVSYKAGYVTTAQSAESGGLFEGETVTMPEDIKMAVALLVKDGLDISARGNRVSSYRLGSKSVTFKNEADGQLFKNIVDAYLPQFIRPTIAG